MFSEGGMMLSEGGIMRSEGGMVPSEGGIMPSEGGDVLSEGGIMRCEGGKMSSEGVRMPSKSATMLLVDARAPWRPPENATAPSAPPNPIQKRRPRASRGRRFQRQGALAPTPPPLDPPLVLMTARFT